MQVIFTMQLSILFGFLNIESVSVFQNIMMLVSISINQPTSNQRIKLFVSTAKLLSNSGLNFF